MIDKWENLLHVFFMDKRFTSPDLTGKRFGRVICLEKVRWNPSLKLAKTRAVLWKIKCDCGNEKVMHARGLVSGKSISCGCYARSICKEKLANIGIKRGVGTRFKKKHGHSSPRTPTYNSWLAMISRCYKKSDIAYPRYGGRGILVCDKWRDFENFLSDMGERPNGKTLDRIDNNKNYVLENCRWASYKEQSQNKRAPNGFKINES